MAIWSVLLILSVSVFWAGEFNPGLLTLKTSYDSVDITGMAIADCHGGRLGEWSFVCSPDCPCDAGQGDCNYNEDCTIGLYCNNDRGAAYGFDSGMDICEEEERTPVISTQPSTDDSETGATTENVDDCHMGNLGTWGYICSPTCPCYTGEGDCDTDYDCGGPLICVSGGGANHGMNGGIDTCETPESLEEAQKMWATREKIQGRGEMGSYTYCSVETPCGPNEGHCDSNEECTTGVCLQDVGVVYGFEAGKNFCVEATDQFLNRDVKPLGSCFSITSFSQEKCDPNNADAARMNARACKICSDSKVLKNKCDMKDYCPSRDCYCNGNGQCIKNPDCIDKPSLCTGTMHCCNDPDHQDCTDSQEGDCVKCVDDAQCSGSCVECIKGECKPNYDYKDCYLCIGGKPDYKCEGTERYCDGQGECVECSSDSHCSSGKCCRTGLFSSFDKCTTAQKNTCVECTRNSHCDSGEVCKDGVCVVGESSSSSNSCSNDEECDNGQHCCTNRFTQKCGLFQIGQCLECTLNDQCTNGYCKSGKCIICGEHGKEVNGKCICDDAWGGVDCTIPPCEEKGGSCQDDIASCREYCGDDREPFYYPGTNGCLKGCCICEANIICNPSKCSFSLFGEEGDCLGGDALCLTRCVQQGKDYYRYGYSSSCTGSSCGCCVCLDEEYCDPCDSKRCLDSNGEASEEGDVYCLDCNGEPTRVFRRCNDDETCQDMGSTTAACLPPNSNKCQITYTCDSSSEIAYQIQKEDCTYEEGECAEGMVCNPNGNSASNICVMKTTPDPNTECTAGTTCYPRVGAADKFRFCSSDDCSTCTYGSCSASTDTCNPSANAISDVCPVSGRTQTTTRCDGNKKITEVCNETGNGACRQINSEACAYGCAEGVCTYWKVCNLDKDCRDPNEKCVITEKSAAAYQGYGECVPKESDDDISRECTDDCHCPGGTCVNFRCNYGGETPPEDGTTPTEICDDDHDNDDDGKVDCDDSDCTDNPGCSGDDSGTCNPGWVCDGSTKAKYVEADCSIRSGVGLNCESGSVCQNGRCVAENNEETTPPGSSNPSTDPCANKVSNAGCDCICKSKGYAEGGCQLVSQGDTWAGNVGKCTVGRCYCGTGSSSGGSSGGGSSGSDDSSSGSGSSGGSGSTTCTCTNQYGGTCTKADGNTYRFSCSTGLICSGTRCIVDPNPPQQTCSVSYWCRGNVIMKRSADCREGVAVVCGADQTCSGNRCVSAGSSCSSGSCS